MWEKDEILSLYIDAFDNYKYVSFDIFDTLLLRKVNKPTDIFYILGKRAIEEGYTRNNLSAYEFQQIRIISQNKAFDKNYSRIDKEHYDNEITLQQIYNEMPNNIGDLDKIMKLEIEIEKQNIYINPIIYDLIKYLNKKGKKIILISNMYLDSSHIKKILLDCNFDFSIIYKLIVSCENLFNKASGRLFEYLLTKYEIKNSEIIHIGDNYDADIQGTKKNNIDSIYYDVISRENYEIDSENYVYGDVFGEIKSLRKVVANLTIDYKENEKFWFKFGAGILSPIFVNFCDYVVDIAIKNNIRKIRPFMREAVLLEPMLKQAAEKRKFSCDIKSIYISRVATLIPSIKKIDKKILDELCEIKGMCFADLLDMFELDKNEFVNNIDVDIQITIDKINKEKVSRINDFIICNYDEEINKLCNIKRKMFVKYLEQQGCIDDECITVDLGYGGTIQDYIGKILKIEKMEDKMLHTIMISSDKLNQKLQKGLKIISFTGLYNENIDFIETIIPLKGVLEETIMGEVGSTIGYTHNKKIEPILDINRIPINEFKYKELCRNGILTFQKIYYETLYKIENVESVLLKKRENLSTIVRFMKYPSYEESFNLLNLHHDDNFGTKAVYKFLVDSDLDSMNKMEINEFLKNGKKLKVIWPEAEVSLKKPSYMQNIIIEKSHNMPRYYKEVYECVKKLKKNKVNKVIIWGAGEVGRVCIEQLIKEKISIENLVDRKEWLWDTEIRNIKIISMNMLKLKYVNKKIIILIASFGFVDEIRNIIRSNFKNSEIYTII